MLHQSDLSKLAKNAGISGIGEVVFKILGYITTIIITRTVGPAVFGVFNLANTIISTAKIFSSAGLGQGLLRFVAFYKGRADIPRLKGAVIFATRVSLFLSLLFGAVIFYLSDLIAVRFFHNPDVGFAIKILMISLPFLTLGELWLKSIQSFQIIKYQVYTQKIYQPIVRLISLVVLFLLGLKLGGILAASIISAVAGFFLAFYYLSNISPIYKKIPAPVYEKKEILNFSIPLFLTQFMDFIILSINILMLGYFMTAADVGIYTAAANLGLLVALPLISFNNIFAPMISEFYGRNEIDKLEDLFKIVTKWILTISLPVFLIFILFARPIMGIFGESFIAGALALIIFGAGQLINAGTGSVGLILEMTGRPKINLLNSIALCVINIILSYLLIPQYGIIGAAFATGLSIAAVNSLRLIEVYYFLRMHPFRLDYLKPCIAGFLSFLLVYFAVHEFARLSLPGISLLLLFFVALYALFIFFLKLEKEDEYILKLFYQKLISFKNGIKGN